MSGRAVPHEPETWNEDLGGVTDPLVLGGDLHGLERVAAGWQEAEGRLFPNGTYFGLCPVCHKTDGFFDWSRADWPETGAARPQRHQWFYCREHRTRWYIGMNLLSRDETEQERRDRIEREGFGSYAEVLPFDAEGACYPEGAPFPVCATCRGLFWGVVWRDSDNKPHCSACFEKGLALGARPGGAPEVASVLVHPE